MIVDEASLLGTFALDELVTAARDARAKVRPGGGPEPVERRRCRWDVRRPGRATGAAWCPSSPMYAGS